MIEVRVTNFQSLRDLSLRIEGLTCLVGPTNVGKSALVRAMEATLYSALGDEFITWGASRCSTSVRFSDPELSVSWSKQRGSGAVYEIDGRRYAKIGRSGLRDEMTAVGIKEFVVRDSVRLRLNFWTQMEPLFLVSSAYTPSLVFDSISSVLEENRVAPVLKEMVKEASALRTEIATKEGAIAALSSQIEEDQRRMTEYERLLRYQPIVERAAASALMLSNLKARLAEGETIVHQLAENIERLERMKEQLAVEPLLVRLGSQTTQLSSLSQRASELESIEIEFKRLVAVGKKLKGDLELLEPVFRQVLGWEEMRARLSILHKKSEELGALLGSIASARSSLEKMENELREAEAELERFKEEIGICPLCGSQIGGGR